MNILASAMVFPLANQCDLHVPGEGNNLVWVWERGDQEGVFGSYYIRVLLLGGSNLSPNSFHSLFSYMCTTMQGILP